MVALTKLFSFSDKILAVFFLTVLPELIRLIILSICITLKHYRRLRSNYKYKSTVNKKSPKFIYRRSRAGPSRAECSICLLEFAEGDEGRELVDCSHMFHGGCLERWLHEAHRPSCPLCRRLVVPEVILAEYHWMKIDELGNDGEFEKELALILLSALEWNGGSCNGFF